MVCIYIYNIKLARRYTTLFYLGVARRSASLGVLGRRLALGVARLRRSGSLAARGRSLLGVARRARRCSASLGAARRRSALLGAARRAGFSDDPPDALYFLMRTLMHDHIWANFTSSTTTTTAAATTTTTTTTIRASESGVSYVG